MVLCKSLDVVFQSIYTSGGHDAGLAHGTAECLFVAPGFLDELLIARQHSPEWSAQRFAEGDEHRVKMGAPCFCRDAWRHYCIDKSRAVKVSEESVFLRSCTNIGNLRQRPDGDSAEIVRLLDRQKPRRPGIHR